MTEPHRNSTEPPPTQGDTDIDLESSSPAPGGGPADEPALTTSEDAQRDDLPVQPGNS